MYSTLTTMQYQFANGLAEISASFDISGMAEVAASLGGVVEIGANIEVALSGSVLFSAGKHRQLVPVNAWISTLLNMKDPNADFYERNFARCRITLDGTFEASVSVKEPFELDAPVAVRGGLVEPFVLDLFNSSRIVEMKPNVKLQVDLPNIGDLSNLSFGVSEMRSRRVIMLAQTQYLTGLAFRLSLTRLRKWLSSSKWHWTLWSVLRREIPWRVAQAVCLEKKSSAPMYSRCPYLWLV